MNGQYIDSNDLRISPFDHGFLYGLGFFETFRTYDGKVPFLAEHFERLQHSLAQFHIAMPFSLEQLREIVATLNEGQDGYFRVNVSAGVHDIGLAPTQYDEPTAIVFRKALVERARGQEKEGIWLSTPRNTPEGEARVKGHAYGNNVLARFEVPNLAHYEGIFTTVEGFVAEGITSNIFWVRDGVLYTPSLSTGILNGITRQQVCDLTEQLDVKLCVGHFTKEALEEADECFITNAVQELVPLVSIGEKTFAGAQGPLYKRLHEAYVQLIEQRIKGE